MSNLFTRSQWQELEYQAMIYKYIDAGVPVPPYLLVPISQNPHLGSSGFLHPSSLAYSYFGKRIDSEPGRCRRTDGKKWRCSKDAHPDSKYCERHMNRSRNRSRKLVESKNNSQPSTSAAASEITAGNGKASSTYSQPSLNPVANSGTLSSASNLSRWCLETSPYGAGSKEYRSLHGLKPGFGGNSSLPEASTTSSIVVNSNLQSQWKPVSQLNSSSITEQKDLAQYHSNYSQQHMFQDFGTIDATISEQPFFSGKEFGSPLSMKQDNQYLYPLFDEWPNQISDKSLPTVQLSMSTITNPFSMGGHSTSDT